MGGIKYTSCIMNPHLNLNIEVITNIFILFKMLTDEVYDLLPHARPVVEPGAVGGDLELHSK